MMKMMASKKVAAGLLAGILLLGASGCGDSKETESKAETPSKQLTEADILAPYPEPVTIRIARLAVSGNNLPSGEEFETNQYVKWCEEKLNMKIEFSYLGTDADTYKTRLNLMTTTGDLPDAAMGVTRAQYEQMVDADLLADMTDIIPQYSSDLIKEYYASYNNRPIEYATIDGRVYAVPNAKPVDSQNLLWVRKDWREKLNIGEPETLDDVIAMARAFVNDDPDGNGQKDTVGLLGSKEIYGVGNGFLFDSIFNAKGAFPGSYMKDDAGKLYYGSVQPEAKEALQVLADMYKEGLIDPEMASRDWNANSGMVSSGQAGMFFYPWHGAWMASGAVQANPEASWDVFAAPSDKDGKIMSVRPEPVTEYLVVNKDYEHPEAVMKLLSQVYQGLRLVDQDAAKIYEGLGVSWGNWPLNLELNFQNTVFEDAISIQEAAKTGSTEGLKANMIPNYEAYKNYLEKGSADMASYGNAYAFAVAAAKTGDPKYVMVEQAYYGTTDAKAMKEANLRAMENETFLKIITGDQPITAFDEFVAKWNKEGGEEILSEMQEKLDNP